MAERRANGKTSQFVEVRRDQWSVYLFNSSRGVNLKIDLSNKQIFYSDSTSPLRSLYPIVGATADPFPCAPCAAGEGRTAKDAARAIAKAAPPKTPPAPLAKAAPPPEPAAPVEGRRRHKTSARAAREGRAATGTARAAREGSPPQEPLAPLAKAHRQSNRSRRSRRRTATGTARAAREGRAARNRSRRSRRPHRHRNRSRRSRSTRRHRNRPRRSRRPPAPGTARAAREGAPPQEPLAPLAKDAPPQEPLAPPVVQPPPANTQEFDYQSFARSAEFANETLTAHNELRARHGAQPLRWSTELARTANDWALSMTSTRCEMEHSGGAKRGGDLRSAAIWGQGPERTLCLDGTMRSDSTIIAIRGSLCRRAISPRSSGQAQLSSVVRSSRTAGIRNGTRQRSNGRNQVHFTGPWLLFANTCQGEILREVFPRTYALQSGRVPVRVRFHGGQRCGFYHPLVRASRPRAENISRHWHFTSEHIVSLVLRSLVDTN